MKHHRPVVHVTPTGTIRQCQDCLDSWELYRSERGSQWRYISETDERGEVPLKHNPLECQGAEVATQERSSKSGYAAVDAKAKQQRKTVPCYCEQCQGKKSHHPDSTDCYCKACRGRKAHYD